MPFEGQHRADCIAAILERGKPRYDRTRQTSPAELSWSVCRKMPAKDRDERYQTARESCSAICARCQQEGLRPVHATGTDVAADRATLSPRRM